MQFVVDLVKSLKSTRKITIKVTLPCWSYSRTEEIKSQTCLRSVQFQKRQTFSLHTIFQLPFSKLETCLLRVSSRCSNSILWYSMALSFLWMASTIALLCSVSCLSPFISSSFAVNSAAFYVFSVASRSMLRSCWLKSCRTLLKRAFNTSVYSIAFSFIIWKKSSMIINTWKPCLSN